MGKFDGVSDEELIARLRAGETAIEDYLMEKYKGLSESPGHVPHRRRYR